MQFKKLQFYSWFTILFFLILLPFTAYSLPGDGTGTATITPTQASSGVPATWIIEFQGHPDYSYNQVDIWIPDGGSSAGDYLPGSRWTDPQLVDSQAAGYTTVIPREGVEVKAVTQTDLTDDSKISIIFSSYPPGSGFRLIYGDTSFSSNAAALSLERGVYSFKVKTKVEGGALTFIELSPSVEIFSPGDTPPEIFHQPPTQAYPVNNPITIQAEIKDDYKVVSANLYFRKTGSDVFSSTVMTEESVIYQGIIPASATGIEGIDYYLMAGDGFHNTTHPPGAPSSYHQLRIDCYDGSGKAEIVPSSGKLNCPETWIVTFTAEKDLSGGELVVYFPDGGGKAPGENWSPPQLIDAYQPGYTTFLISGGEIGTVTREVLNDETRLNVPLNEMPPGTTLNIIYGDDKLSSFGKAVPRQEGSYCFPVHTKGPNGILKPVANLLRVEVIRATNPENFSIVINEIMWGSQNGGEWLELYNRGTSSVEVSGWSLKDKTGIYGKIPPPQIIPPHGHLVLVAAPVDFQPKFPNINAVSLGKWPSLNDEGDTISLLDNASSPALIDEVKYTPEWGGSKMRSVERINPDSTSSDPANWATSVNDDGGTPGKVNSVFGVKKNLQICDLDIRPNPFSPDKSRSTKIYYQAPVPSRVSLYIYDLRGRMVRRLLEKAERGGTQEILWDGKDEQGHSLPSGIYLCYLEIFSSEIVHSQKRIRTIVIATGGK